MWTRRSVVLALALAAVVPCRAWDQTGHEVAAYIAWQRMTPEARAAVSNLLRHAPPRSDLLDLRPSGPDADMIHFIRASIWPDIVRDGSHPERQARYHRGPWHYTNIFWEETADGVRVLDRPPSDPNVVERLTRLEELARSDLITQTQKAVIVAWLAHLVGDIHQPLHASARVTDALPEGDRGGSLFAVAGDRTLHQYWDGALTDAFEREVGETDMAYVRRIAESLMAGQEEPDAGPLDYAAWAERSFRIAAHDAYDQIEPGEEPSTAYQEMAHATAAASVVLAGVRLGALMNDLFG